MTCPIRVHPRALVSIVTSLAGTKYTFAQPIDYQTIASGEHVLRQEQVEYSNEKFCDKKCINVFLAQNNGYKTHLFSKSKQILLKLDSSQRQNDHL